MTANHEPVNQQGIAPEQGPDSAILEGNGLAQRLQRILEDRDDADAARRAALLEDPRTRTLLETGQVTIASELAARTATGTTELPRIRSPKRTPVNRRGGRSHSEGTENELDPHWTGATPELPLDEKVVVREKIQDYIAQLRIKNATEAYRADVDNGDVPGGLARLRAKGFMPDPRTKGTTIIPLSEASNIREGK